MSGEGRNQNDKVGADMGCCCRDLSGVGDRGEHFPVAGKARTARTAGALLEGATCWSYGSARSTPSDVTISLMSFTNALHKGDA